MMLILWLLIIPFSTAILCLFLRKTSIVNTLNITASSLAFIFSLFLVWQLGQKGSISMGDWFYIDYFSAFLLILTTFIGLTTAIFSARYLANEQRVQSVSQQSVRFFYSLFQFFFFSAFLILMTNSLGILWVAMEGATLSTVLLVGFYRTPQSLEAAWKYLILCGLGLAQALLGTILIFFAADELLNIHNALLWTELHGLSNQLSAPILSLAFVFILIGYGTKAGLVPLHNWLPDAYGESMAPVLSLLSGVLLNLAFYAILRIKFIVDGATGTAFSDHLLLGFGLLNIIVAAFFLLRQREIKRLYAYSSIEHIGLISIAFGIGTPLAVFAGLLHMLGHTLSKTAAFFSAGQVVQMYKTLSMENIRGLIAQHPKLGWGLLLSSFSLLALPPSALFTSEFLILYATIQHEIWLAIPLFIGLFTAFAAILHHIQRMAFLPNANFSISPIEKFSIFPIYLHLILIMGLGLLIPVYLAGWFDDIIYLISDFT